MSNDAGAMTMRDYLTISDVVARYRGQVSEGTLAAWRSRGKGPAYTKVGNAILYPADKLVEWEKTNTFPGWTGEERR